MPAEVRIEADQASFNRVARAVNAEADGRELRADLVRELDAAVQPAVQAARAALGRMRSRGHAGASLRAAVGAAITSRIALRGDAVGVRVVAAAVAVRGFRQAAKRINAPSWRHPVFGRGAVTQVGAPGFFDQTLDAADERARAGVAQAMQDSVDRIARKA